MEHIAQWHYEMRTTRAKKAHKAHFVARGVDEAL